MTKHLSTAYCLSFLLYKFTFAYAKSATSAQQPSIHASNAIPAHTPALWDETFASDGRKCASLQAIPTAGVNLTAEEEALLPDLCWPLETPHVPDALPQLAADRLSTVPAGVKCDVEQWYASLRRLAVKF